MTITDSLTGTAVSRGVTQTSLAIRAAKAGTDMLLVTGSEASTKAVYAALLAQATADEIIEKHLAAIGGRDALAKLTSQKATGTMTIKGQSVNIN